MFQDEYEITDPKAEAELRKIVGEFMARMGPNLDSVILSCWMVDLLWQIMTDTALERNKLMRQVWYQGVSMGEFSKRTGISKGRISKIIHK